MSEPAEVHLHIGAAAIATDVVEPALERGADIKLPRGTEFMKPRKYRRYLRHAIQTRRDLDFELALYDPFVRDFIRNALSGADRLVLSRPEVMGRQHELIARREMCSGGECRVRRLVHVFDDAPVTLHLCIAPQSDCLPLVAAQDRNLLEQAEEMIAHAPSWAGLVSRLREAAPSAQLFVWDFADPFEASVDLLAKLANVDLSDIGEGVRAALKENACFYLRQAQLQNRIVPLPPALHQALYDIYLQDLHDISAMQGVRLIRRVSPMT